MCFYIDENNPNKQIAKKDITCWKVLKVYSDNRLRSLHYPVVYNKGKVKRSKIEKSLLHNNVEVGLHSFTTRLKARVEKAWFIENAWMYKWENYKIVKCIIPAGSTYYINKERGEYVSNKIMMV